MDVKFIFALGDKVLLESGRTGVVESNSVTRNYSVNRVLVEYFDQNGAQFSQWFDENRIKKAE